MKTAYEEYLRKYHTLTYKNVGVSMLPLLKQGRDSFTVREMKHGFLHTITEQSPQPIPVSG